MLEQASSVGLCNIKTSEDLLSLTQESSLLKNLSELDVKLNGYYSQKEVRDFF